MISLREVLDYLKNYDGPSIKLMEVCGTHTSSIFKSGIRSLISDKIKLISGPGCPVCVTPAGYIDKVVELACSPNTTLFTFGDMIKVPGSRSSLADAKAAGGSVEIMYSPLSVLDKARECPERTFVVAAVGFETTAPIYALLLQKAMQAGIENLKLLTALKTIIPALEWLCASEPDIDGFICPGHTSTITGQRVYEPLASKYKKPFVISGFEAEHILAAIYDLVRQIQARQHEVHNLYQNIVRCEGNQAAYSMVYKYFEPCTAVWRGLGSIDHSGLFLKPEYERFNISYDIQESDHKNRQGCLCGDVITGRIAPNECPMFASVCTPVKPLGPCMVSQEGTCGIWYREGR